MSFALRSTLTSIVVSALLLCCAGTSLPAQQSPPKDSPAFPPIRQHWSPDNPAAPYTAAEWNYGVRIFRQQADADQSPDAAVYPEDSIRAAISVKVRQWLKTLKPSDVRGLQLDPYGMLHVVSGQDDGAQRIFAQRLATPGITLSDSAFTLSLAVQAFADPYKPERFAIAEQYMARLDALPKGSSFSGASIWQFGAHSTLSRAYFLAGNKQATKDHAIQAVATVPHMYFMSRMAMYSGRNSRNMYLTLAHLLLSANDSVTLRKINEQLLTWITPPDSLVAEDSSFYFLGKGLAGSMRSLIDFVGMLGRPAPGVRGTSWMNVSDTTDHEMSLADGKVHIVGIGRSGHALTVLPAFSRIAAQFGSNFQPVFLLITEGSWGTEFVTPRQETDSLKHYFIRVRPSKVPIAIWAGEKIRTRDGGSLPAPSPTLQNFRGSNGLVALIDQQGKIRHLFTSFGREEEKQVGALIRILINTQQTVQKD